MFKTLKKQNGSGLFFAINTQLRQSYFFFESLSVTTTEDYGSRSAKRVLVGVTSFGSGSGLGIASSCVPSC